MRGFSFRSGAVVVLAALLTGCAGPQSLYSWNGYGNHVYNYLKHEADPESQILALEKGIQQASAKGQALPPGYYAHLGLLYLNTARTDQAVNAWQHEKQLFPESTAYMDYLLNNLRKNPR
jgi:hypothetical protein